MVTNELKELLAPMVRISTILPFAIAATLLNLVSRPPFEAVLERASRFARAVS